jgi:hypothetical protein
MEKFRMSILLLTALVAISISSIPGSALGGNISISSTPSGAAIFLGNTHYGPTPFVGTLASGSYALRLTLNGYDDWTNIIDVVEGNTTTVSATLSLKSSTQNPAPTLIAPIITSPSATPAPTYMTSPSPIATYSPKQTQTPLPIYSGGSTPTNTQTTETSKSLDWIKSPIIIVAIGALFIFVVNRTKKNTDWQKDPLLYIIILVIIGLTVEIIKKFL